jgi:hypothetical protein
MAIIMSCIMAVVMSYELRRLIIVVAVVMSCIVSLLWALWLSSRLVSHCHCGSLLLDKGWLVVGGTQEVQLDEVKAVVTSDDACKCCLLWVVKGSTLSV